MLVKHCRVLVMSDLSNTERSKLSEVGASVMQEDVVCLNITKASWSVTWSPLRGVTAGPTLGLIPSVHLQRHCQPVQPDWGGRAGVDREKGEKEKRGKGDWGGGGGVGGNRKRAEWKECTLEGEECLSLSTSLWPAQSSQSVPPAASFVFISAW